jgi:hypothetical protein
VISLVSITRKRVESNQRASSNDGRLTVRFSNVIITIRTLITSGFDDNIENVLDRLFRRESKTFRLFRPSRNRKPTDVVFRSV